MQRTWYAIFSKAIARTRLFRLNLSAILRVNKYLLFLHAEGSESRVVLVARPMEYRVKYSRFFIDVKFTIYGLGRLFSK